MKRGIRLAGRTGVVLDTMVFIYLLEDIAPYADLCQGLLQEVANGSFQAALSPITAAELLVKPLKEQRPDIADRYRAALRSLPNLVLTSLDVETGFMAAALRAKYGLPLPDMMQVALALQYPRPTLVTNDRALKKIEEVEVVLLDDLAKKAIPS